MKANYKTQSGGLVFEVLGQQAKDIWAQIAQIQSLFEAEVECQLCKTRDLRYDHRITKNGGYNYYELVCRSCGGFFRFGQLKATLELFPRRKDEHGNWLPDGGWKPASVRFGGAEEEWGGDEQSASEPVAQQQPPPQQRQPPPQQRQPPPQQRPPQPPPQRQPPPQQQRHQAPPQQPPQQAGSRQSARDLVYEDPPPPRR